MVHRSQSARSTPAKQLASGSNLRATASRSVDNLSTPTDDDDSKNQLSASSLSLPDAKVGKQQPVKARRNSLNTVPPLKPPIGKAKKAAARKRGGAAAVTKTANKDENARLTTEKLSPAAEASASGHNIISFSENNNETDDVDKGKATKSVQRNNKKTSTKQKNCDRKSAVPSSSSSVSSTPNSSWLLNESSDNTLDGLALMFDQKPDAIKICCSVPLDRLPGILDTLPPKPKSEPSPGQANKSLCLYCDRWFGSQSLRLKHIERVHKAAEGRRTSARTSTSLETSPSSTQQWPGCGYCTEVQTPKNATLISDDLAGLFRHLVNKHADKYFACQPCSTRFVTDDQLAKHMKAVHQVIVAKSSKKPKSTTEESRTSAQLDFDDHIASLAGEKTDEEEEDVSIRVTRTSAKKKEMSAHDTMLHRLGLSHFRSPRTRKGAKNRRGAPTEGRQAIEFYGGGQNSNNGSSKSTRNSKSGRTSSVSGAAIGSSSASGVETTEFVIQKNRNEVLNCTFDEDFYDQVSVNVRKNLSCHLDGKLEVKIDDSFSNLSPPIISPLISAIRNTPADVAPEKSPSNVESEIHEATSLPTVTAFPTLLTVEQFDGSATGADRMHQQQNNKTKKPITKNSWKWKWDCVKKYKYVNEGGKIVKKVKQQQTGLRDLSKLDMWTQLAMRAKYESAQLQNSVEARDSLTTVLKRQEKCKVVEQLNQILDTRLIPQINLEQDDQRVIKLEKEDDDEVPQPTTSSQGDEVDGPSEGTSTSVETFVPELLNLRRNVDPQANGSTSKVILSGEWARPRCYICYQCGAKLDSSKALEDHKTFRHPHIYSTHYEIVGRELLERELYKYFFIPSRALVQQKLCLEAAAANNDSLVSTMVAKLKEKDNSLSVEDSLDSLTSSSTATITTNSVHTIDTDTNTITSTTSTQTRSSSRIANLELQNSVQQTAAESQRAPTCTKCKREANGQLDLYRHMLDCSGDYAWMLAKKRMKHRRAKKRRGHRGARSGSKPNTPAKDEERRKRLIEQRRNEHNKQMMQPKTRPGDAESIQRMLENLPPKRACRQILQNPTTNRRIRKISPQKLVATKTTTTSKEQSTVNIVKQTKKPTRRSTQIMRSMINSTKNRVTRSSLQILKNVDINKGKRKSLQTQKKLRKPEATETAENETADQEVVDAVKSEKLQVPPTATVTTTTTISTTTIVQEIVEGKKEEVLVDNKEARSSPKPAGKQPFIRTLQQNTKRMVKKITNPFKKPQKIRPTRNSIIQKPVEPAKVTENAEKDEEKAVTEVKDSVKPQAEKQTSARSKIKKIVRKLSVRKTKTVRVEQTTTTTTTTVPSVEVVETKTEEPVVEATTKPAEDCTALKDENDPLKKMLRNFRRKKPAEEIQRNEPEANITETTKDPPDDGGLNKILQETPATTSPAILPATTIPLTAHSSLPLYVHTTSTESINELTTPRSSGPPTSPLKTPPGKKKVKRINDCIAKLTGKLQEKMGVPFFESTTPITSPVLPPVSSVMPEAPLPQPLDMSKKPTVVDKWEPTRPIRNPTPPTPIDENGCLDLSLPKKNRDLDERMTPALVSPKLPNPAPHIIITPTVAPMISPPLNKRKITKPPVPSVVIQPIPSPVKPKEILLENADNRAIIQKLLCNNVEVTQITGEQLINRRKSTRSELGSPTTPSTSVVSYTKPANTSQSEPLMNVAPENASTPNTSLNRSGHSKDSSIFLQNLHTGSSFTISPIMPVVKIAGDEMGDRKLIPEPRKILKESQFPASLLQVLQKENPLVVKPKEISSFGNVFGPKPNNPAVVAPLLAIPQPIIMGKIEAAQLPLPIFECAKGDQLIKPVKKGKKCKKQLSKDPAEESDKSLTLPQDITKEKTPEVIKTPVTKRRSRKTKEQSFDNTSIDITPDTPSTLSSINNSLNNLTLESANASPEKAIVEVNTEKPVEETVKVAEPEKGVEKVKVQEPEKKLEVKDQELEKGIEEVKVISKKKSEVEEPKKLDETPPLTKSMDEPKEVQTPTTITPTEETGSAKKPETKQKKRRKNELAKIIADQLLESFKEVDKSRIDELKVLHDLSIENNVNNDDLIVSTIRTTPIPRRKAAERVKDYQLEARTASPLATTKSAAVVEDVGEKKKSNKQQTVSDKVGSVNSDINESKLVDQTVSKKPEKPAKNDNDKKEVEIYDSSKKTPVEDKNKDTVSKPTKKKTKKELALEKAAERKQNSSDQKLDQPEVQKTVEIEKPVAEETEQDKTKHNIEPETKPAKKKTKKQLAEEKKSLLEAVEKPSDPEPEKPAEENQAEQETVSKPSKKKTKTQLALERKSTTPVPMESEENKIVVVEEPKAKKLCKPTDLDKVPETLEPITKEITENVKDIIEMSKSVEVPEKEPNIKEATKQNKNKKNSSKKNIEKPEEPPKEKETTPTKLQSETEQVKTSVPTKKKPAKPKQIMISDDEDEPPIVNIFADAPILTTKRRSRKDVAALLQNDVVDEKLEATKKVSKAKSKKENSAAVLPDEKPKMKPTQNAAKEGKSTPSISPVLETGDAPDTPGSDSSDLPLVRKGRNSKVARKLEVDKPETQPENLKSKASLVSVRDDKNDPANTPSLETGVPSFTPSSGSLDLPLGRKGRGTKVARKIEEKKQEKIDEALLENSESTQDSKTKETNDAPDIPYSDNSDLPLVRKGRSSKSARKLELEGQETSLVAHPAEPKTKESQEKEKENKNVLPISPVLETSDPPDTPSSDNSDLPLVRIGRSSKAVRKLELEEQKKLDKQKTNESQEKEKEAKQVSPISPVLETSDTPDTPSSDNSDLPLVRIVKNSNVARKLDLDDSVDSDTPLKRRSSARKTTNIQEPDVSAEDVNVFKTPTKRKTRQDNDNTETPDALTTSPVTVIETAGDSERKRTRLDNVAEPVSTPPIKIIPMKPLPDVPIVIQRSDRRRSNREISELFDRLKQPDPEENAKGDEPEKFEVSVQSPVEFKVPPVVEQQSTTPTRRKSTRLSNESPIVEPKPQNRKSAKIGNRRTVSEDDDVVLVETENEKPQSVFRPLKEPGFKLINQLDDSNNFFDNMPRPGAVSVVSNFLDINDETLFNDFDIEPTSKITDMVNDIIKNAELSESDAEDDVPCLADIKKGMNDKLFPSADDGDLLLGGGLQKISLPELESLSQSKKSDELASEGKLPSPPVAVPVIPSITPDDSLATVGDDEEETNTDIVDMDIDDDISVITDCTLNRSASSQNSTGTRGKRRKYRRCVFAKSKRTIKAASVDAITGEELTFDCDICKKTFRKADSLAKHKMTLTHIAKLSEQEFLRSELQKEENAKAAADRDEQAKGEPAKAGEGEKSQATSMDALEKIAIEASLAVVDAKVSQTPDTRKSTPSRNPPSPKSSAAGPPAAAPSHLSPTAMRTPTPVVPNQSGIEPISSPEHLEPSSYTKYSGPTMRHATAKATTTAYDNSRMALSQEEKLFFECCSMLKDSKPTSRHASSSAGRLPIQPNDAQYDTNERGAGVSNLVYSVKSPMSHSRSSPRPAFPKIDANQFSDISSDSNPIIFPGRNQYAAKHKIFTSIMNEDVHLPNFMSSAERYLNSFPSVSAMGQPEASQGATLSTPATISTQAPQHQNYTADSFSDDMADSFPYSQEDVSENENYTPEPDVGETARSQTPLSSKNNSPAHSAASSCSEVSKFRTKAALKGFDNLKVSIPTTCLDLEQALLKSAESKLAALADIALMGSTGGTSDLNLKTPLDSALLPTLTSPKKPTAAAKKNVLGNNLGFKVTKKNTKKSKTTPVPGETNDVYDFDEFADAEESPETGGFRSKPPATETKGEAEPPIPESPAKSLPHLATEDSQQSATSYSDRDDCTFGVASPSTSNAEDGSDDSDSEESTGVSSMALSKRIKRSIAIEANIEQKKSLIWGRIFKKKDKVEEKVPAAAQKAEPRDYDRMFDTLRQPGEGEAKVVEKATPKPQPEKAKKKDMPAAKAKKGQTPQSNDRRSKHVKNKNIFTEIIDNATIIPELKKSGRSREVAKLEAEWQMSVEEIEEIIGIGNRKSTRRCAAGKQKILAETWSSDDFEDFQGNTEDVIKMIETADDKKEGKNPTNSRNNSKSRSKKDEDKGETDSPKAVEPVQKISEESVKENILKNDESSDHETTTPNTKKATKKDESSKSGATSSTKRKVVVNPSTNTLASKKSSRKKTMRPKNIAYDSDSDFEVRLKTTAKPVAKPTLEKKRSPIKNRRKTTAFKEIKKPEPAPEPTTASSVESTPTKATTTEKRGTHSDNETRVKFNLTNVGGEKKQRSSPGNPAMRRKRVASEMLYYWSSSSSDEEFGKISETAGDNENNEEDEHFQQHGWIVGDHKKLVTLLAHAKGKKTDDGGVKESHRKKS